MTSGIYVWNAVQWIIGSCICVAVFLVLKATRRFVLHRLGRSADRTGTWSKDLVVVILRKTRFFFFAMMGVYAGSQVLTLSPPVHRMLLMILILGMLLHGAICGHAVISFLLSQAIKQRVKNAASATTLLAVGVVAKLVLFSFLALIALDNLGVKVSGFIVCLGIGGVAAVLAMQNILRDLFALLSITLEKPFVIGDFVIVDQLLGTVEHIDMKSTRIRILSGEQIVFPNADLLNGRIKNYQRMYDYRGSTWSEVRPGVFQRIHRFLSQR